MQIVTVVETSLIEVRTMKNEKPWEPQPDKWNWRAFLTADEAKIIKAADDDRASIARLEADYQRRHAPKRQKIVNRAIHRAKYEHSKGRES